MSRNFSSQKCYRFSDLLRNSFAGSR